jgi:uncharacterized protein YqhQ
LQNYILKVGIFITYIFLISSSPKLTKTISKEMGTEDEDFINKKILERLNIIISP